MAAPEHAGRGRIAIVGGGLVGASLALALLQGGARERGWTISLIEPHAPGHGFQPSYDARCSALSFGTRLIYEGLGLWPAIAGRAEPITRIHVSERGRFGATRLAADEEGVPALGYVADTAKADKKKYPKHDVAQKCSNCQLFQGKATDAAGGCGIFPGKQVAAKGWCSAYVKKAG